MHTIGLIFRNPPFPSPLLHAASSGIPPPPHPRSQTHLRSQTHSRRMNSQPDSRLLHRLYPFKQDRHTYKSENLSVRVRYAG